MNLTQEEIDEMAKRKDLDDDTEAEEVRKRLESLEEELYYLLNWLEFGCDTLHPFSDSIDKIRSHMYEMRSNFFGMWGQKSRLKKERNDARAEVQAYKLGAALHDAARRKDVNVSDLDPDTIKAIIKAIKT